MKFLALSLLLLVPSVFAHADSLPGRYILDSNDCMGFQANGSLIQIDASEAGMEISYVLPEGNSAGKDARQILATYRGGDHKEQFLGVGYVHTVGKFNGSAFAYTESFSDDYKTERLARSITAFRLFDKLMITHSGDTPQPVQCSLHLYK